VRISDGKGLWKEDLPVNAIKDGAAVDAAGILFVTLEDIEWICFRRENVRPLTFSQF